jgi:hypothetical protein
MLAAHVRGDVRRYVGFVVRREPRQIDNQQPTTPNPTNLCHVGQDLTLSHSMIAEVRPDFVDRQGLRPVFATRADRCHVSHVVADTDSWEQKMAQTPEDMDEVIRYVKNHNLGFTIPYTIIW